MGDVPVLNVSNNLPTFVLGIFLSHSARKKTCIYGYGSEPFCGGPEEPSKLEIVGLKEFEIPYAQLQPCGWKEEDTSTYGIKNDDAVWEDFVVELYQEKDTGFVGYRHYGASNALGKAYCLGSTVFGPNTFKKDLFIHDMPANQDTLPIDAENDLTSGNSGALLSTIASGDIVFLFPCSNMRCWGKQIRMV
jgi:hypothetical protein